MTLERSPERDAALDAMLPFVPDLGWTTAALVAGAGRDADLLFPGGARDMVEAHSDLGDRRMEDDAAAFDMAGMRVPERVRAVIALRLSRSEPDREAVRRALGVLALPGHAVLAARCLGRTVDAVWRAAGDGSADLSWYTKRGILAGVYGATILYWLRDSSFGSEDTLAFLDRRLAGVGQITRMRRGLSGGLGRLFRRG